MTTSGLARKLVLPTFVVTETCDEGDPGAVKVEAALEPYFVRAMRESVECDRRDGKPNWVPYQFNLFPLVLQGDGSPWAEANLFLLSTLENCPDPDMRKIDTKALDLAAYRRFIEEMNMDWTHFPSNKLYRPTYRYRGHLNYELHAGKLKPTTISRRMSAVVAFYRWLIDESILMPEHPPWKPRDVYITSKTRYGFEVSKKIKATDLSIRVSVQTDPYAETIQDGGKLRPLPRNEQEWLVDALLNANNIEMTLMHLMALVTGARLQTICTMKIHHARMEFDEDQDNDIRLAIGPGTGIDTKNDRPMALLIPPWLYRALRIYADSERSMLRQKKSAVKTSDQYLFLTRRGTPYYMDKEGRRRFDPNNKRRYDFDGGAVGTFIRSSIKPYIEKKYLVKTFDYKFHDTRATFGMNLTEERLDMIGKGQTTLAEVREYVKTRMGHESAATTDLYLNFKHNLKLARKVVEEHEKHLQDLARRAMEGLL